MKFPEKPTCHGDASQGGVFKVPEARWRPPREYDGGPYKETHRTCYFCGSIHPEDLLTALEAGARLGGSDWKYGWPHKFYVENLPNPIAGQDCDTGSSSRFENGQRIEEKLRGVAPAHGHAKWYNEHLQDAGFDDEARARLIAALERHAGIRFELAGNGLRYRAPYDGYQR